MCLLLIMYVSVAPQSIQAVRTGLHQKWGAFDNDRHEAQSSGDPSSVCVGGANSQGLVVTYSCRANKKVLVLHIRYV
jgi:hypothetical protein